MPGYIHAKAAIIDREVLWDGSLNILSQRESKEIMRRTVDADIAKQMLDQLGLNRKLAEGYKYQYELLYRNLVEKRRLRFAIAAKLKNLAVGIPKFFSRLLSVISRSFVLLLRCIKLVVGLLT